MDVRFSPLTMALTLASVFMAGCLGSDDGTVGVPPNGRAVTAEDVVAYALPRLVQSHEHDEAADEHAGSIGFRTLGHAGSDRAEGYGELVVKGDFAYLSTTAASGNLDPAGHGGFVVYDITTDTPSQVGRWLGQPLGDLEVSDDGRYAFASTQRNGYPYTYTLPPATPPTGLAPRGVSVVDLADPSAPETMTFMPLPPNGPHTITYVLLPDGTELVLAMTYDILFTAYPENIGQATATQKVVIYRFDRDPAPALVPLAVFQVLEPDEGELQFFPHDATVHIDPATDRVIMDVAYWDRGLVLVDITDPTAPVELARFDDTAPSKYVSTHLVRVFPGTIDGRTVAVLEPEIPTGDDTGTFTFVDVTDPTRPVKLGAWMLPGGLVIDEPFRFSPHNFDVVCAGSGQATGRPIDYAAPCVEPRVVLSHNHAGLWALDASDPTEPRPLGFFFPDATEDGTVPAAIGTVFVQDGKVYAPESRTGLYVLALDAYATGG